jgi:hypothetical protein
MPRLLALGQQLREMIPNYGAARDKYYELHGQAWSQAGEACPNFETFATDIAYRKARGGAYDLISQENGTNTALEAWDRIVDRIYPLIGTINEATATTFEGLAIKAIATAWEFDGRDEDERLTIARLISSVMELAGQELPRELVI